MTLILFEADAPRKESRCLKKETGIIENSWRIQDGSDFSYVKSNEDTERSPGDLRTYAVAQTPLKDHQLKLE